MAVSFSAPQSTASADVSADRRAIYRWLMVTSTMVFAMVVIGGITRLTESGLSMVEWRALHNTFPPLGDAEWARQFALYQETPEFQIKNFWMTVDDYKTIFWWEWIHRTWGRLIGLVFVFPFLWFLVRGRIERALLPRLTVLLFLGGLQGGIGWWMVKSGLVDEPDVSQYRLAVHLTMAFIIQALLVWTVLDLKRGTFGTGLSFSPIPTVLAGLVLLVVVSGAFVAGTDAGYIYNTFPLMGGQIVPESYLDLPIGWLNVFESPAAIQFNHRLLAIVTLVLLVGYTVHILRSSPTKGDKRAALALVHMAGLQVGLGIATLLLVVPVWLGALHQGGAFVLFSLAVMMAHVRSAPTSGSEAAGPSATAETG